MNGKIKLDLRRAKKDGSYPIIIEIKNNDKIRISTPYSSLEEKWDGDIFSKKELDYKRKNIVLKDMLNKVDRFLLGLVEDGIKMTDKKMREEIYVILNKSTERKVEKSFLDYLDEFVGQKKNVGTKQIYLTTRNKIEVFDSKCTFETMDKDWLIRFEDWMSGTMKVNAYAIHLRNIRSVFNYAIDEEYTTLYPFRKFSIKKEETRKRCLTVEQLRTLQDYPCEEYQIRYRDMFMLMFYMIGINASDLFMAKKEDVVNGRLEYKRHKTGKLYSIKIEPEAQTIIDRYMGKGDYLLDIMDNYGNYKDFLHRMGVALKQIGETERKGLGGKKSRSPLFSDLSSYWSRHTWATIAAELDIPMETISKALGHSYGCDTTAIYINFDMRKVDEANRKVIDYLFNGIDKT